MSGLRFSIANMLAAVAIIGVGLAALNAPSPSTALALIVATVSVLLVAILATVYGVGAARAFWLGVALFGWFYFVVAFTPAFPEAKGYIERPLRAFRSAFWTVTIPDGADPHLSGMDTGGYDSATKTQLAWPSWHHGFGATIHCLVNLLFALAGGIIGRLVYATAKRANNAASNQ
jgi:hypothetical protein